MSCALAAGAHVTVQAQSSAPHASPGYRPIVDPFSWDSPLVDGIEVVFVDQPAPPLATVAAGGGPLQRFASRPGAWYTVAFLPLRAQMPVQAWLWHRRTTHDVRVTALNAAPWSQPTVSVPIAVRTISSAGRPIFVSTPFALPANTSADGVFLLIEQWSPGGVAPGPLWLRVRSRGLYGADSTPWWSTRAESLGERGPPALGTPPSPLNAHRGFGTVLELPIQWRRGSYTFDDPWGPQ